MENKRIIDGYEVTTYIKEFFEMNGLEVEVGTNGFGGGDGGHGSRTFLRIHNVCDTFMKVEAGERSLEVTLGGDSELRTFSAVLQYAADVLRNQMYGMPIEPETIEQTKQQLAFTEYLREVMDLYSRTKGLKGISEIRQRHHVAGLTKEQFYELGLHTLSREGVDVTANPLYCNNVYEYALRRTDVAPEWK